MSIRVEHVSKRFGNFQALDDVSLSIEPGELVALLGPSGSGKTTLLRVIAGLEEADAGRIFLGDREATGQRVQERAVGFVFQHYALFRHMTIFENVAFGLRVKARPLRPGAAEIRQRVQRLLELVQLDWLGDRYPHQLSGGQRQRIALARALAVEPRVLLLDEPFGALDAQVRKDLRRWLRRLHDDIHLTSVFVTHDQEEALEVADRVVVFNQGRIEQVGAPHEVYDSPDTAFVYSFLGHANRFAGQVRDAVLEVGSARLPAGELAGAGTTEAVVYVRPHDLEIVTGGADATLTARFEHAARIGAQVRLACVRTDNGAPIEVEVTRQRFAELKLEVGAVLHLALHRARAYAVAEPANA